MLTLQSCLISSLLLVTSLASQSVLTVGVNGQYADVPAAIAAAQAGDTVRCLQWPPFQLFTAPVITKGLTLDGGGANGLVGKTVIRGIPAGERVVMHGFAAASNNVFDLRIVDCVGRVHIDGLSTTTSSPGIWPSTSIEVLRSNSVSLHRVYTHGSPAVSVVDSTISLDLCKLGANAGGNLAGGRCINGLRSTIMISQPHADAGDVPVSAIFADRCDVTIAGRWQAGGSGTITGGSPIPLQLPALEGVNSTLTLSPTVSVVGGVTGFTTTMHAVPYHRIYASKPGGMTSLYTYGPIGDIGIAALTLPAQMTPSPFGSIWIDPLSSVTYSIVLDHLGKHYLNLGVPTSTPVGFPLTLQGFVLTRGNLEITLPSTFVIRD